MLICICFTIHGALFCNLIMIIIRFSLKLVLLCGFKIIKHKNNLLFLCLLLIHIRCLLLLLLIIHFFFFFFVLFLLVLKWFHVTQMWFCKMSFTHSAVYFTTLMIS